MHLVEVAVAGPDEQASKWTAGAASWADLIERQRIPLYDAILDLCGVGTGTRFLDAGCGSGGLAQRAAIRGAVVSGYDVSEGMVALARQKMPAGDFRVGSLDAPPFGDDSFDVAAVCDCVYFADDLSRAVGELARMSRENGVVAIAVWEMPERSDYSTYFAAMIAEVPQPPKGSPLSLSGDGMVETLLDGAGLAVREAATVPCDVRFPSFETFWQTVSRFAVTRSMIDEAGEPRIRDVAYAASQPCIQPDGALRYRHAFRVVTADV